MPLPGRAGRVLVQVAVEHLAGPLVRHHGGVVGRPALPDLGDRLEAVRYVRRAERAEDTVLRSDIEEIRGTGKSLMPEGLEAQLSKQDLADLIAYLRAVAAPR